MIRANIRLGCPSGWLHIKRSDPGARKNEYMSDESGCGGSGVHNWCCPASSSHPECGWYNHNNGNCDSKCPSGSIEIGSNNNYCKKSLTYQAACCTTANYKSMKLYTKGEWGAYPMCENTSKCPVSDSSKSDLIASASAGTGSSPCNNYYFGQILPEDVPQERKYCYDSSNKKERFSDCTTYDNIGLFPSGAPDDWCKSGCPSHLVRVGMGFSNGCADFSRTAICCSPDISDTIQVENPKLETYRDALEEYMKSPRCKVPSTFDKRDSLSLAKRDLKYPMDVTHELLLALLAGTMGGSMNSLVEESWNNAMGTQFNNLHFPALEEYVRGLRIYDVRGPIEVAYEIICNLNYWNQLASKNEEEKTLVCYDPTSCSGEACYGGNAGGGSSVARSLRSDSSPHSFRRHRHVHRHVSTQIYEKHASTLEKRTRSYDASFMGSNGRTFTITVTMPPVRSCVRSRRGLLTKPSTSHGPNYLKMIH